jgi:hypothetical protein
MQAANIDETKLNELLRRAKAAQLRRRCTTRWDIGRPGVRRRGSP